MNSGLREELAWGDGAGAGRGRGCGVCWGKKPESVGGPEPWVQEGGCLGAGDDRGDKWETGKGVKVALL